MKIYADVLFAINFSMDLISLFITSSIMRRKTNKKRVLISSTVGGIYGVLSVIFPLKPIILGVLGVIVSFLMCYITFYEKSIKRLTAMYLIYWGISACLGGFMSVLYSFLNKLLAEYIQNYSYTNVYSGARFLIIAILAVLISVILGRFFTNEKDIKSVVVVVELNNKTFEIKALCDSGNLLTEPISGKSVILVSENSKIGEEISKISDVFKRYIPFSSVGGEGMLKGVVPKSIKINDVEKRAIIAPITKKRFCWI